MSYPKVVTTSLQFIITVVLGFVLLPRIQVLYFGHNGHILAAGGLILWVALCVGIYTFLNSALPFFEQQLSNSSTLIVEWADKASVKNLHVSIVASAALLLFLELSLIRWQGSLFATFALYKNFTLLACFCGLGIGFALAKKLPILLLATLPMLAVTLLFLTILRYGTLEGNLNMLNVVPVTEERSVFGKILMIDNPVQRISGYLPVYLLLFSTFTLNVLTLLPIGQFCGFLMDRTKSLTGYGLNLIGSIIGVLLLFIFSWLWLGPVIWFGLCAAIILWFLPSSAIAKRIGIGSALLCVIVCAWPTEKMVQNIYSPYQLIQKVTKPDGYMQILASGSYYQKVYNFGVAPKTDLDKAVYAYYELPFRTAHLLDNVAIVGAGSGNDVAAAIRNDAGSVDAVEIDPAIRDLGKLNHPEHPYDNPKVHSHINDARSFFRSTHNSYDAIIYGVLDSHILLSHGSNVRVDSFVYTKQGLQDAYAHLKPGGLMSVSFALSSPLMGAKIYNIMKSFEGAGKPVVIFSGYDGDTNTFMISRGAEVVLPNDFIAQYHLKNVTADYENTPTAKLDLPTDDWPFFYMDTKMYPTSYVISLGLILILSIVMVRLFIPTERWQKSLTPFFFLGGGFMLTETKAITELGLIFGNTWHVVGITIISVLVMAFFANFIAARYQFKYLTPVYLLLFAVIAIGFYLAKTGGLTDSGGSYIKILSVILLTSPLFFSGIIFSSLVKNHSNIASVMAYNLMGAMLGGLLEYNSMQFGFASLYIIALALYAGAFIFSFGKKW